MTKLFLKFSHSRRPSIGCIDDILFIEIYTCLSEQPQFVTLTINSRVTILMNHWQQLLSTPQEFGTATNAETWFENVACQILNHSTLVAGEEPHRITEIEFYLSSRNHPDPFTHRDALQQTLGRWYFHRTGDSYRGGSFKGLDLTFGDSDSYGGILIRSLTTADGKVINGPCLCVERILQMSGQNSVAELDARIENRQFWEAENPVKLIERDGHGELVRTARVGLTLKRQTNQHATHFILKRYRYLREPEAITKGKIYTVLALHADGLAPEKIRRITKSPLGSIKRWIEQFESGRESDFREFFGVALDSEQLCRLHGLWHSKNPPSSAAE